MPPVRTLRLGLLVVSVAIVGLVIHVNGDGGPWELLVWALAFLTAIVAVRLAHRESATSLARIAAATGTVPYSGRRLPHGLARRHGAVARRPRQGAVPRAHGGEFGALGWERAQGRREGTA